jgi:hypothetical protein
MSKYMQSLRNHHQNIWRSQLVNESIINYGRCMFTRGVRELNYLSDVFYKLKFLPKN